MLIEQIIELKSSGPGPQGRYMYSYNWLFSWKNKNLLRQIFEWTITYTAKIRQEAMHLTYA